MSSTVKNIATILILITAAYAGYIFFVQEPAADGSLSSNDQELQDMLAKTSVFIDRSQELDQMMLDTSILEDERFRSLITVTAPVKDEPVGRPDPFAAVSGVSNNEVE